MKILLTSIIVNNPVEAYKFYTEVLGFKEKQYLPEAGIAVIVSPEDIGGTAIILEPNFNPLSKTFQQGLYKSGIPVIVFGVDDIQSEYEKLKAKGVVFKSEPKKSEWGTHAILDDTCGNYVQIHQA